MAGSALPPSRPASLALLRFAVTMSSVDTPSYGIVTRTTAVSLGSVMVTAVVLATRQASGEESSGTGWRDDERLAHV
jgi:hypothetical protein